MLAQEVFRNLAYRLRKAPHRFGGLRMKTHRSLSLRLLRESTQTLRIPLTALLPFVLNAALVTKGSERTFSAWCSNGDHGLNPAVSCVRHEGPVWAAIGMDPKARRAASKYKSQYCAKRTTYEMSLGIALAQVLDQESAQTGALRLVKLPYPNTQLGLTGLLNL